MAAALGEIVYPGPSKEIGWKSLTYTNWGKLSPFTYVRNANVLHCDGNPFDLPHGATLPASAGMIKNQAFALENFALTPQFQIEVTANNLEQWLIGHTLAFANTDDIDVRTLRAATAAASPKLGPLAIQAFEV